MASLDSLISMFLPVVKQVAANLEGTEWAADAVADVQRVEGIAARHMQAADAELVAWWTEIRHPQAVAATTTAEQGQGGHV